MLQGLLVAAWMGFTVSPGVEKIPLSVTAKDGSVLQAWFYRYPQRVRPALIFTGNGVEGSKSASVDALAGALFLRGFDVVTWDRRGTGESSGVWDYGRSDAPDLAAVVTHIQRMQPARTLGLVGHQAGGAAALRAARALRGSIPVAVYGVGVQGNQPAAVTTWLAPESLAGRWLLRMQGVALPPLPPEADGFEREAVTGAELPRGPLLIAAGSRSNKLATEQARALFDLAPVPKEWVWQPGAGSSPPLDQWAPNLESFFMRRLPGSLRKSQPRPRMNNPGTGLLDTDNAAR